MRQLYKQVNERFVSLLNYSLEQDLKDDDVSGVINVLDLEHRAAQSMAQAQCSLRSEAFSKGKMEGRR